MGPATDPLLRSRFRSRSDPHSCPHSRARFGQARTIPAAIAAAMSTRTMISHDARMPEITPEVTPESRRGGRLF